MPVREPAEDPKVTALRESRCLNLCRSKIGFQL